MGGLAVVLIGGFVGTFFAANLMQWYYTKRLGAEGIGYISSTSCRFDLGWTEGQLRELRQDMFDLRDKALHLEDELAELRTAQLRRARHLKEMTANKGVQRVKTLGKRIVGVGGRIHGHMPLPKTHLFSALRRHRETEPVDEEAQVSDSGHTAVEDEYDDLDGELEKREREIEAELRDLRVEEQTLQRMQDQRRHESGDTNSQQPNVL